MLDLRKNIQTMLAKKERSIKLCDSIIDEKSYDAAASAAYKEQLAFIPHTKHPLRDHIVEVINSSTDASSCELKLKFLIKDFKIIPDYRVVMYNCTSKEGFKLLLDSEKRFLIRHNSTHPAHPTYSMNINLTDNCFCEKVTPSPTKEVAVALFEYFVETEVLVSSRSVVWIYDLVCSIDHGGQSSQEDLIDRVVRILSRRFANNGAEDVWNIVTSLLGGSLATSPNFSKYQKLFELRCKIWPMNNCTTELRVSIDLNPWVFMYRIELMDLGMRETIFTDIFESKELTAPTLVNEQRYRKIQEFLLNLFTVDYLTNYEMITGEFISELMSIDKWMADLKATYDRMIEELHCSLESKDLVNLSLTYLVGPYIPLHA
jgi:hypothetical protein